MGKNAVFNRVLIGMMFISGVELIYAPLEPSVSVAVLLGFMTLALGVALSYLTLADVADRARAPS